MFLKSVQPCNAQIMAVMSYLFTPPGESLSCGPYKFMDLLDKIPVHIVVNDDDHFEDLCLDISMFIQSGYLATDVGTMLTAVIDLCSEKQQIRSRYLVILRELLAYIPGWYAVLFSGDSFVVEENDSYDCIMQSWPG